MTRTVTLPELGPRSRWLATGGLAALLVVALGAPALGPRSTLAVDSSGEAREHTITVGGSGRVLLAPDVADLRLGVSITRPTVREARDEAASAMSKVVAALKAAGIAARDIQTAVLSLQPVYDYNTNGKAPRLTGYQLTNVVSVTIRHLDRLAEAIDASIASGATTLEGVTFRVDDRTAAERQARSAAMADARSKADTLASAAGVSITGVSAINETSASIPTPMPYAGAAPDRAAVPTPVEAGTLEVSIDVTVVYVIK
ncbi:MAG TPA: SIMPL domain-containing protein [Candidatus Limnocylindrales bacterium]